MGREHGRKTNRAYLTNLSRSPGAHPRMVGSPVISAYFLVRMVNEASVNRKEAQAHNELTFECGINKELEIFRHSPVEEGQE